MQFVPAQWFTAAGDAALSGGVLKFYAVGTSTPKDVFADYLRTTSIGSEITLDAGGRATIFLDGLYRVALYNSLDELVSGPIDGIGGGSTSGEGSTLFVSLYDDLRALDGDDARAAVVEGRTSNGDGGAGLFVWDALETADDDGGTILAPLTLPASGRWVRVRDPGSLSPRWYGVTADGTTDDRDAMGTALAASIALGAPVVLESGLVRLGASLPVSSGASIRVLPGAGFTGAPGVVLGLPSGTKFEGCDDCFRGDLTASFGALVSDPSPSWWDRASEDDQITLALASVTANGTRIVIDRAYTIGTAIVMAAEPILSFSRDGRIVWNSGTGLNVVIQKWEQDAQGMPRFNFGTKARLTSLTMANDQGRPLSPRLFGGAGAGSSDDTFAVWPAFLHGWVDVDGRFQANSTLTAPTGKSVVLEGRNPSAIEWAGAEAMPSEIILGDGVDLALTSTTARITAHRVAFSRPTYSADASQISNVSAVDCLFASDASAGGAGALTLYGSIGVAAGGLSLNRCKLYNVATSGGGGDNVMDGCVSSGDAGDDSHVRGPGGAGSPWKIRGTSIDVCGAFLAQEIAGSTIGANDEIVMTDGARITGTTISPSGLPSDIGRVVTSGTLIVSGGALNAPIEGTAGHDIYVSGAGERISWNGLGNLIASGAEKIGADGDLLGSEQRDTMRATAVRVDGVDSPYQSRHTLSDFEVLTGSTVAWSFGASIGSPSIASSRFEWAGFVTPATSHTITRTITTDEEKILSAFGGYIDVEWTGACNVQASTVRSSDSTTQEVSGLGGLPTGKEWPSTGNRMVYMVWPGSTAGADLVDRLVFVFSSYDGGDVPAGLSIKITVRACAPLDPKQWADMWGGDRSLVRRYNSWKATQSGGSFGFAGNFRGLECWVETLPNSPFTPRPETVQPWLLLQVDPLKLWPLMLAPIGSGESNATQPIYSWKGAGGTGFRTRTGGEG
jgi:hypothetical protein